MQNKIAIILPVRDGGTERHKRITRCLDSYRRVTQGLSDIYLLHDDDECHIYDPILKNYPEVTNYCVKSGITLMEKINVHAMDIANEYKYIGFIGDDIVFKTKWEKEFLNWLSTEKYALAFANDLLHTTGELATHPFITSNMIKALGFYGLPVVTHHYFDNYWMKITKNVGKIKFFENIIMEHMHPVVNKAEQDSLYHIIEEKFNENQMNYNMYIFKYIKRDIQKILDYKEEE
jgi:hypothetical protein